MMRRLLFLLSYTIFIYSTNSSAQPNNLNSYFTQYTAITWSNLDSNNYIYEQIRFKKDIISLINSECPFSIEQAEQPDKIIPVNTYDSLHGLHAAEPFWDTILQEIRVPFILDNVLKYWYAYKNTSAQDSTTAFLIIPGSGVHNGWQIASGYAGNYHNVPMPIRDALLPHGDVFTISKFNEDFRSIWRDINGIPYKLNYNVLGPLTNNRGQNWAANLVIESIAAVKWLRLRYDKVIVLGLSNGGIISLISALEGNANGAVIASGLSVHTYDGFPVPNFENPLYYRLHAKYSLDSVKRRLSQTNNYYLFGFGDNDFYASYEYQSHALQDTLLSGGNTCHLDFTYNYSGHHYPISYLDTFINKVKTDTCAPVLNKLKEKRISCLDVKPIVKTHVKKGKLFLNIEGDTRIEGIKLFDRFTRQLLLSEGIHSRTFKRKMKYSQAAHEFVVVIQTKTKVYTELIKL